MNRTPFILIGLAAVFLAIGVAFRMGQTPAETTTGDRESSNQLGLSGTLLDEPWERPQFTLTTTDGEPYDFHEETAGRLTLLFFGYTSCPDICPIHLVTLSDALDRLSTATDPIVVFVGVDSARDTAEVVGNYVNGFNTDFVGLVGTPEELEQAQEATGVPVAILEEPDASGNYLVGHAAQVLVYTPDDLAHIVYPFGVRVRDWINDLPRLTTIDWRDAH